MSKADFEKAIDELLLKSSKSGLCLAGESDRRARFTGPAVSFGIARDDSAVVRFRLYFRRLGLRT